MRRFRGVLALSVLVGAVFVAPAGAQTPPPNILIIVTDDQRAAGTMRVLPETRRIFERGGVTYPNGFAVTPLCCPSRATIMTGRYAHNTGVKSNAFPTALDATTIFPRLLQESGYQTGLVGKFLNSWPNSLSPPYFDRWALGGWPYFDPRFNVNGTVKTVRGYSTDLIGAYARRFLRRFETDDSAPWLLYVAPHAPHYPWKASKEYKDVPLRPWRGNPAVLEADRTDKPPYVQDVSYTLAEGRIVRDGQLRTLMSVDDVTERLFTTLRDLGERNTLAFFLSDNGFLWADHGFGGAKQTAGEKRVPYTPSVRIPFFARWPGHLAPGTKDRRLTGTVDIAPTALAAAGVAPDPTQPALDGRSLLEPNARDHILLEYWQDVPWVPTWASLRTETYQYIETYGDDGVTPTFREYYDLVADPFQLLNLLGDEDLDNDPDVAPLADQLALDRACVGTTACP